MARPSFLENIGTVKEIKEKILLSVPVMVKKPCYRNRRLSYSVVSWIEKKKKIYRAGKNPHKVKKLAKKNTWQEEEAKVNSSRTTTDVKPTVQ